MLALFEYFWTAADWVPAPPASASAAAVVSLGAGSGRADSDFWEIRERYIRRLLRAAETDHASQPAQPAHKTSRESRRSPLPLQSVVAPPPPAFSFDALVREQAIALAIARAARSRTELQRSAAKIVETSRQLSAQRQQTELEYLALLLATML